MIGRPKDFEMFPKYGDAVDAIGIVSGLDTTKRGWGN
jgi:hypothetical protein